MTPEQNQALENLLQIVRESAEEIINKQYNDRDLLLYLYQKGFEFMQNQSNQNIVDIGSVGLAYAVMRSVKNDRENN